MVPLTSAEVFPMSFETTEVKLFYNLYNFMLGVYTDNMQFFFKKNTITLLLLLHGSLIFSGRAC